MKILRKLIGKNSEQKTSERTGELNDTSPAALEAMVNAPTENAEHLGLQLKAVSQLVYGEALRVAAASQQHSEIEKAARQRLADLLDQGHLDLDTLKAEISDTETLLAIAAFSQRPEIEATVIAGIDNEEELVALCRAAHTTQVRQALAARIATPEILRELAKELKNRDKTAYKIIKAKLDEHKETETRESEVRQKILLLCDEMEQLVSRFVDKDYALRFGRLQRLWQDVVAEADADQRRRFDGAERQCRQVIENYQNDIRAETEFENQLANLEANRRVLIDNLWSLINRLYDREHTDERFLSDIRATLDEIKVNWSDLEKYGEAADAEKKAYVQMTEAVEVLTREYRAHGSMISCRNRVFSREGDPESQRRDVRYLNTLLRPVASLEEDYPPGENVVRTRAILQRLEKARSEEEEHRQKLVGSISGLIRKAQRAAEDGRVKQAIGIRHSIEEKLKPLGSLPAPQERSLESLDDAIEKLVDWQAYAVVPKKEALISAMENLIDTDTPSDALATKIKNLQDEWKSLSQNGKDRHEDLWEKFSKAADRAYEPCKIYYDELAAERLANLEKRRQIVTQLEEFNERYDWEKADWKHVEKIIRGAKPELHSYSPVDRGENKTVQAAFDRILDALQTKLQGEFDKNRATKEQLIAQAEKLNDMGDIQQAIDGAKRLQAQWKTIGNCHYRDNDRLWKAFRKHCDAVFSRKEQQVAERRAETDQRIDNARRLVDEMVALSTLEDGALLASRAQRDELQQQMASVDGMPEKVAKAINRDFSKALDTFDRHVANTLKAQDELAWHAFFEACEEINHYHLSVMQNSQKDEDLHADIETFVASITQWPEGAEARIQQKLRSIGGDPATDVEENHRRLRLLCIRAEILADKPSPEEDRALRMEHQVTILQQGLGQVAQDDSVGLARDWADVGAVDEACYRELFDRFHDVWKTL